ncbi:hypothetical protein M231_07254 [Tremella mesenterica]|uniref:Uncharacterized protein n=1 Tax=Tremella mesenterica TaxID=5217 RepID=A0A4Q1BCJ0_TREME|nr:hypothetical protein M231_07254 [Tremella mesenterica]
MIISFFFLISILTLYASAQNLPPPSSNDDPAHGNHGLHISGQNSTNGTFSSTIPVVCYEGCLIYVGYYTSCYLTTNSINCTPVCTGGNYTGLIQCLNCRISNGEQDLSTEEALAELEQVNQICKQANVTGFVPSNTISAVVTTTGPFTTTAQAPLEIWTGLSSYVDQITNPPPPPTTTISMKTSKTPVNPSATVSSSNNSARGTIPISRELWITSGIIFMGLTIVLTV